MYSLLSKLQTVQRCVKLESKSKVGVGTKKQSKSRMTCRNKQGAKGRAKLWTCHTLKTNALSKYSTPHQQRSCNKGKRGGNCADCSFNPGQLSVVLLWIFGKYWHFTHGVHAVLAILACRTHTMKKKSCLRCQCSFGRAVIWAAGVMFPSSAHRVKVS